MILRPDPRGMLAIGQPAHAWLSGRLAEAWRWQFAPLDAVRLAPGVTRQFEGGPEGIEILVFGARHEGDGETVDDWWTQ